MKDNDKKCAVCGHDKFFHKSIFERCGEMDSCHFVECKCQKFIE